MAASSSEQHPSFLEIPSGFDEATVTKFQTLFAPFSSDEEVTTETLQTIFKTLQAGAAAAAAAAGEGASGSTEELTAAQLAGMRAVVEGEKEQQRKGEQLRFTSGHQQSLALGEHGEHRRRSADSFQTSPSSAPHLRSLLDLWLAAVERFPERPAFGTFDGEQGAYVWKSFRQANQEIRSLAAGLARLCGLSLGSRVGINLPTCYEWQLANFAILASSYSTVTLYDTFGSDALRFIANKTKLEVIFTTPQGVRHFASSPDTIPASLKHIIVAGPGSSPEAVAELAASLPASVTLHALASVVAAGAAEESSWQAAEIDPDRHALLCFTSGTTGNPKGAIHTHASILASVSCGMGAIGMSEHDVHLAALPLAHIMEYWVQLVCLGMGGAVAFFRGDVRNLLADIALVRPTILVTVPRLLSRIFLSVINNLKSKTGLPALLAALAIKAKEQVFDRTGRIHSYWDYIVFDKVRAILGGRVRVIATGSAPVPSDVLRFFRLAFSATVLEGYGTTETAVTNITFAQDHQPFSVGPPLGCVEIKLASVPDMNYSTSDQPCPRGEILVRGPCVSKGYFEEPELTQGAFEPDGWYHTGDIGRINPNGTLSIIDRVKDLFKLAQGEYVSPAKLENLYSRCPYIAQLWVHGDSLQPCLVAVAVPDPDGLRALCSAHQLAVDDFPALTSKILESINHIGAQAGVNGYEHIRALHLHPHPFSVENDLLTPTQKLKRHSLRASFRTHIETLYASFTTSS